MTLVYSKNNKPDTRMVEYDQAIIRLGLEKARIEGELKQKEKSLKQVNIAYDIVRSVFLRNWEKLKEEEKKEAGDKISVLSAYQRRIDEEERNLESLVTKQKDIEDSIKKEREQLASIKNYIKEANKNFNELRNDINKSLEEKRKREADKSSVVALLNKARKDKEEIVLEVKSLGDIQIEKEEAIEKANKELKELNEIISILQISNKQGLDLVASFEGERKRLREKEEFLVRKEKDLSTYEKRIEKRAKKVGVDLEMTFK